MLPPLPWRAWTAPVAAPRGKSWSAALPLSISATPCAQTGATSERRNGYGWKLSPGSRNGPCWTWTLVTEPPLRGGAHGCPAWSGPTAGAHLEPRASHQCRPMHSTRRTVGEIPMPCQVGPSRLFVQGRGFSNSNITFGRNPGPLLQRSHASHGTEGRETVDF
jgi:hypothetical protein